MIDDIVYITLKYAARDIHGSLSRCSYLNPGKGLQMGLAYRKLAANLETVFLENAEFDMSIASVAQVRREMHRLATEHLTQHKLKQLEVRHAAMAAWQKDADALSARQDAEDAARIETARKNGFHFRTLAVIHPTRGDDMSYELFSDKALNELGVRTRVGAPRGSICEYRSHPI